jgi:glycerophosphoryl diester phosphodiesterase
MKNYDSIIHHASAFVCLIWVVIACGKVAGEQQAEPDVLLIAHRGVITEEIPENSLASLEETIRRGYTHIEVDLRCTKDGHAVCLHDDSLRRTSGLTQRVSELTLAEVRELVPVERLPDFAAFCEISAGRIGLMPDIKEWPPDVEEAFAQSIEEPMVKHGLMENAFFIGKHSITAHFASKGRCAWGASLEEAKADDRLQNRLGDHNFIFGHAVDFDALSVKAFQALGLKVIVSINTLHYLRGGGWEEKGNRDVARMLEYGVDGLQIDSVYDPAFRKFSMASGSPATR